ncbi:hypothetical protein [Sphingomonas antarctica]|uniref:hypothetical protein n=1 Tax=Sphingomonas antarctica TaxID=2040274 RepID=UPI0039E8FB7B
MEIVTNEPDPVSLTVPAGELRKDAAALHGTASTVIVGITTIGVTGLLTGNHIGAAALGVMAGNAFPKLRPSDVPKSRAD